MKCVDMPMGQCHKIKADILNHLTAQGPCFTELRNTQKKKSNSIHGKSICVDSRGRETKETYVGPLRGLNPGPPAPKAGIIPLYQVDLSHYIL